MKTHLFILFLIISNFANAQEVNCVEKENQINASIANKDYKKAFEFFNEAKTTCTSSSEKIFVLGSQLLQYNIEIAAPQNKEIEVRELIKWYNLFDKNYPNNQNGNYEKIAMLLYENKVGTSSEIFSFLELAFEKQINNFTNPQALFNYFDLYFKKYKSVKSTITKDNLLEKYSEVKNLLESNRLKNPRKADEYDSALQGMNYLMKDVLVCDNLTPYAQKNFETNKSNGVWLQSTTQLLYDYCKKSPIFETLALQLHALKPSSKSAFYLAKLYVNTVNQEKGIGYFIESVSLSNDKIEKAEAAYVAASILVNSDKEKAKEMLFIAIENNPTSGKNFIFLANLYANSVNECGFSDIEIKGTYKLASDTALKAAIVEPRFKPTSEILSKEYLKNVVFDGKSKIKSVKIGCWINQTVQF
ncbi:hypothetical protein [Flavobacterium sp.]|uniref:hypothetical protein n=1 Tax=Flavobacterium sp. TaxID=239 RepID=UPI003752C6DC